MSKTKHTPWGIEVMNREMLAGSGYRSTVKVDENTQIDLWVHFGTKEKSESITKLIAAAPELLQALIDVMKQENGHGKISFDKDGRITAEIKAAIKKATT